MDIVATARCKAKYAVAKLKIVESYTQPGKLSLRGPAGASDGPHRHLTEAGFLVGTPVVVITQENYDEMLADAKEAASYR